MENENKGLILLREVVSLMNKHLDEWEQEGLNKEQRAERTITVLINLCGSILISMTPDYHLMGANICHGIADWIEKYSEKMSEPRH